MKLFCNRFYNRFCNRFLTVCFLLRLRRYTILDAPGHNAYVPNMIQVRRYTLLVVRSKYATRYILVYGIAYIGDRALTSGPLTVRPTLKRT